jgi:hypothetical protein
MAAAGTILILTQPAYGQVVQQSDQLTVALAAVDRAEQAAKRAREAAVAARVAAEDAEKEAGNARLALAAIPTAFRPSVAPPVPEVITEAEAVERKLAASELFDAKDKSDPAHCTAARRDITLLPYTEVAAACERLALQDDSITPFQSQTVTGVGTSIATAGSGSSATFTLRNIRSFRNLRDGPDGTDGITYRLQRTSRLTASIGVRADFNKDDKTAATIATFGERDRLTSDVALLADFGWSFSRSERTYRTRDRAVTVAKELETGCRKEADRACSGLDLVQWVFATKDGAFDHPDAVKLYNSVFWGPPKDKLDRFGFLISGELSRPNFTYYPFVLTTIPDPFNPTKTKTVIDPAHFPASFGSLATTSEARYNWSLGLRGFFHLSKDRFDNGISNLGLGGLSNYFGWNAGTTFLASVAVTRDDQTEEAFKAVSICPPVSAGAAFATDQACTKIDIAAPRRKDGIVLGGEIRQQFVPFSFLPSMMVAPRLTYDVKNDEGGFTVPVYFAVDNKGTFTSGLRLGHQWGGRNLDGSAKKAETVVGVVVSAAISLDGNSK